jgi:hypothetical protein
MGGMNQQYNGGGNGGAIVGGLIGGMILGGMLNQMNQPHYAQQPRYYQQPMYQPECQRVFAGSIWNGYQWVQQWQMICD